MSKKSSQQINDKIEILRQLKRNAGSHSPSRAEMLRAFGEDPVKIDACFLSNPYATELVKDRFQRAMNESSIDELIEAYPPGQKLLLEWMSKVEGIDPEISIVCNGAVQAIEWLMGELNYKNALLPFPTFSTYYEALPDGKNLVRFNLIEENNFEIDDEVLIGECKSKAVDLLVLISPNNPTGLALRPEFFEKLAASLPDVKIIIDESFIHFSEGYNEWREWRKNAVRRYPQMFFIKSLSKDYGMAGFRIGYVESSGSELKSFKKRYGTWNINNFGALCLREISKSDFALSYESARLRYHKDMLDFKQALKKLKNIKAYPTDANFVLLRLTNCDDGFEVVARMLVEHGVYVRTMEDKIGLDHTYLRVAIRTSDENEKIIAALSACAN
jgi:histidinol-phosphate/aromatic aminotransferase/cobyric acid decarboxylase-like protein